MTNIDNLMLTAKGASKVRKGRQKIENLVIQRSSSQAKVFPHAFNIL